MFHLWSEEWLDATGVLQGLESLLRSRGAVVRRGGNFEDWDLEIRGGLFGGVRIRAVSENYGPGKQMLRLRSWPWFSIPGMVTVLLFLIPCLAAAVDGAIYPAAILGALGAAVAALAFRSGAVALGATQCALVIMDFDLS
jgi:hypothetical protein